MGVKIGDKMIMKCGTEVTVIAKSEGRDWIIEGPDKTTRSLRAYIISDTIWKAGHKQKLIEMVGNKFTLNCGVEVTVMPSKDLGNLLVMDDLGNSKIVSKASLVSGSVSWKDFGVSRTGIRVGSVVRLNCGVVVTIVEYRDCENIVIQDSNGNTKITSSSQITSGSIGWREFGVLSRGSNVQKGDKFMLNSGVEVEVVERINNKEVVIKDSFGNTRKASQQKIREGQVYWKEGHGDWDTLKPEKGMNYVYLAKLDGIILYVGKGKGTRYTHINSGTSNVYALNELHFRGVKIEVEIYRDGLTGYEATELEKLVIKELKPLHNVKHNR